MAALPDVDAGRMLRVAVTEAQAAVVGFRFLDNDDDAGIMLDGATMAYPRERGAYIVETLEFYAEQLRYNPGHGLDGHRERRSTLALARKVRAATAAAVVPSAPAPAPDDQVADVALAAVSVPGDAGAAPATGDRRGARAAEAVSAPHSGAGRGKADDRPAAIANPTPAGALALLERPNIEDLLQRFLNRRKASTIEAYRKDLAHFAAWLGLPLREAVARLLACDQGLANRLLDHYAAHMRATAPLPRSGSAAPRLSPATVNRRLAAIRSLVKMARLHGVVGWTIDVEGERVEPYRDTRGPGRPAVRRMVDQLDEAEGWRRPKAARDRALLRLMWDLGLRRGELVELDLEHLDVEGGRLSVLGKGRSERVWLDLPEETLEALELWLIYRGGEPGPLFCSMGKGGRVRLTRLTGTDVYRQVRPLGELIGARARPHGVRHSSITGVLEASGGDRRLAQTFARHRDGRVTDRYDDARQNLGGKAARLAASLL